MLHPFSSPLHTICRCSQTRMKPLLAKKIGFPKTWWKHVCTLFVIDSSFCKKLKDSLLQRRKYLHAICHCLQTLTKPLFAKKKKKRVSQNMKTRLHAIHRQQFSQKLKKVLYVCQEITYSGKHISWNSHKSRRITLYNCLHFAQVSLFRHFLSLFANTLWRANVVVLQRNILWSEHPFSFVYVVTHCLETCIISTCSRAMYCFLFWMKRAQTPFLIRPCVQTLNNPPIFCPFLLASLILRRGTYNCFHKTSCNFSSVWHTDVCGCSLER